MRLLLLLFFIFATPQSPRTITIYPHEKATTVAQKLFDAGIIRNPNVFIIWARILGYDKKIKPGRYKFTPNEKLLKLLKTLSIGGEQKIFITIPEGYTIKQIGELLDKEGICSKDEFYKACHNQDLINSLNIKAQSLEGYLFPDSYDFLFNSSPEEIIKRMVKRFFEIISKISDIKNPYWLDSIVRIASLVEKEAKLDEERPIIASVFYNRLRRKMPLQSCATIQYILEHPKNVLTLEDTKLPSPYNTYLNLGLPPTAICNPGQASLQAAIFPQKTNYLYFAVSKDGRHYFSKTFAEHEKFLRTKRNNTNIH
ncbi:MAG: endolytic transglycosylase MltG [candidate division WOR-3 bacterium]|nr:endolytic transglycosylase MltG [candidate division WOR-3 bacterium]MCX7757406.1 endolytic transglycosylase MltG [candidate division WOR-3 bacterium]MDW7987884.1 endolytic transglycosylase MltG [candidate division WOR-3 bacterium]